jgi:hypothetical protein
LCVPVCVCMCVCVKMYVSVCLCWFVLEFGSESLKARKTSWLIMIDYT